jgi:hypothetical protein
MKSPELRDDLIDVNFLRSLHPELSEYDAFTLMIFCFQRTIAHKECYGDGSIMFPLWVENTFYSGK